MSNPSNATNSGISPDCKQRTTEKPIDIAKTCAICLSTQNQCGLFPVYRELQHNLSEIFDVQVETTWKICIKCLNFVIKAAHFRNLARKSDRNIQDEASSEDENEE